MHVQFIILSELIIIGHNTNDHHNWTWKYNVSCIMSNVAHPLFVEDHGRSQQVGPATWQPQGNSEIF
jgi:hypothetical protein